MQRIKKLAIKNEEIAYAVMGQAILDVIGTPKTIGKYVNTLNYAVSCQEARKGFDGGRKS